MQQETPNNKLNELDENLRKDKIYQSHQPKSFQINNQEQQEMYTYKPISRQYK